MSPESQMLWLAQNQELLSDKQSGSVPTGTTTWRNNSLTFSTPIGNECQGRTGKVQLKSPIQKRGKKKAHVSHCASTVIKSRWVGTEETFFSASKWFMWGASLATLGLPPGGPPLADMLCGYRFFPLGGSALSSWDGSWGLCPLVGATVPSLSLPAGVGVEPRPASGSRALSGQPGSFQGNQIPPRRSK